MSKPTPGPGTSTSRPPGKNLHIVGGVKGGTGKTFVARVLAEHLDAHAFDADQLNRSLSQFGKYLEVTPIDPLVMGASGDGGYRRSVGSINARKLDPVFDKLAQGNRSQSVLDCPPSLHCQLRDYLIGSNVLRLLLDHGVRTWFHIIVDGGAQAATLAQALETARTWSGPGGLAESILWENNFRSVIEPDRVGEESPGTGVRLLDEWSLLRPMVKDRVVTLPPQPQLFLEDIERFVTRRGRTFSHALQDAEVPIFSRSRLYRVWVEIEWQLEAVLPDESRRPSATASA